jgi:tRNA(fMet)-specific endonuclease VapC
MKRYMLDTNTVSYFIREIPSVTKRVVETPMASLCISAITEGELLFGIAKRPEAKRLRRVVAEFLSRVEVVPWDSSAAESYGQVRAVMERKGTAIAPLDLLIGSHALSLQSVLVTSDQAFAQMEDLEIEDWLN